MPELRRELRGFVGAHGKLSRKAHEREMMKPNKDQRDEKWAYELVMELKYRVGKFGPLPDDVIKLVVTGLRKGRRDERRRMLAFLKKMECECGGEFDRECGSAPDCFRCEAVAAVKGKK